MKKLKRFWFILPVIMAIVALIMSMNAFVFAQSTISNTLTTDITSDIDINTVELTWSLTSSSGYQKEPLTTMSITIGQSTKIYIKANNKSTSQINDVSFNVNGYSPFLSVTGLPIGNFNLPAGETSSPWEVTISALSVGLATLNIAMVQ